MLNQDPIVKRTVRKPKPRRTNFDLPVAIIKTKADHKDNYRMWGGFSEDDDRTIRERAAYGAFCFCFIIPLILFTWLYLRKPENLILPQIENIGTFTPPAY